MNPDKYERSVALLCPTCGCSTYSYDDGVDETVEMVKCASCGRTLTKDELIHENSENLHEHASEVKDEIMKDVEKELKDTLKKAFSGNKNIRIG